MEPRGRGRGYGRARGQTAGAGQPQQQRPRQSQQQRPGPPPQQGGPAGPQQGQPRPVQPPPQGAWVRPVQPAASSGWPRPPMGAAPPPQLQPMTGRGVRPVEEPAAAAARSVEMVTSGGGDAGAETQRTGGGNSVRGRVVNRREIVFTRPQSCRTKKGTTGSVINLSANFLSINQPSKWCLFQYRVDFAPDIDHTGIRRRLVRTATQELITGGYLFDGTVLFTPQKLNVDPVELFAATEAGENIRITIKMVGELAWQDSQYLQLFNIIMRKCLTLMGLQQVGRHYYMPQSQIVLSEHRIQLWPGYFTSMRQHESSILLNVDLQFKFMRTDNVYEMFCECQGANLKRDFQSKIIGSVVLTYYNNKTYRIDDVDYNSTPSSTFTMADGTVVTYMDYFKKKYNVNIRVARQPMLVSRSKPREIRVGMPETVYLVPELCQLTGLSDRQRENFQLMKALAEHTRVGPDGRIKKLIEFARKVNSQEDVKKEIRRWDLSVAENLVQFQGRVLPQEAIVGGANSRYPSGNQADWTRDVRAKPMMVAGRMERLAVVTPIRLKNATQDFVSCLEKTAGGMKWSIGKPIIFDIPDDRTNSYLEKVEQIINSSSPTLILVVLSSNSGDRYNAIKKKCCVDRGVPTQMIVARNLTSKGVMSIATKVAIQMNCKIGGAPWSVTMPLNNLMVVGYDVCRDTVNKKKSFAGIVASLDRQLSRYYNASYEHTAEEELSNNFATFMVIACKKFKEINGVYPERIVVYRDGVGEGQIPYVHSTEVKEIKRKLTEEIYKAEELKMCFIIVSKRINTKIFAGKENPPPGTVVDDVITLPERYDFYIVSQCVRQGTVGPTSYNVIEDTLGLPADKIQILTYKMTHLYYNWSGTVRVPAPCQYAHKLSFLMAQSLHRNAHRDLECLQYYL